MTAPGPVAVFCYFLIVLLVPELVHVAEGVWICLLELIPQQGIFHFFISGEMIAVLVGCFKAVEYTSGEIQLQFSDGLAHLGKVYRCLFARGAARDGLLESAAISVVVSENRLSMACRLIIAAA